MSQREIVFIDVREEQEFEEVHLEGAINLPLSELSDESVMSANIPKDSKVILYCNSGRRSGLATDVFNRLGYVDVINGINQKTTEEKYLRQLSKQ